MPRKIRSRDISRRTRNAERHRKMRSQLTSDEKELKKEEARIKVARYRASQTNEQKDEERCKERMRMRKLRECQKRLAMQIKTTKQEKAIVIKTRSKIVKESKSNMSPKSMKRKRHTIKDDSNEQHLQSCTTVKKRRRRRKFT